MVVIGVSATIVNHLVLMDVITAYHQHLQHGLVQYQLWFNLLISCQHWFQAIMLKLLVQNISATQLPNGLARRYGRHLFFQTVATQ